METPHPEDWRQVQPRRRRHNQRRTGPWTPKAPSKTGHLQSCDFQCDSEDPPTPAAVIAAASAAASAALKLPSSPLLNPNASTYRPPTKSPPPPPHPPPPPPFLPHGTQPAHSFPASPLTAPLQERLQGTPEQDLCSMQQARAHFSSFEPPSQLPDNPPHASRTHRGRRGRPVNVGAQSLLPSLPSYLAVLDSHGAAGARQYYFSIIRQALTSLDLLEISTLQ